MREDKTIELMSILSNIDDESFLDDFINTKSKDSTELSIPSFFQMVCNDKKISKSELIKNADIDRTYGYQILNGKKNPSRDKILQLCISAKLNLEETNKALKLGNVGELYVKVPRDSVIIFCINKCFDIMKINEMLYDRNLETLGNM